MQWYGFDSLDMLLAFEHEREVRRLEARPPLRRRRLSSRLLDAVAAVRRELRHLQHRTPGSRPRPAGSR